MFSIDDCGVKVVTGRRTQTVNVRSAGGGEHAWIVRMNAPDFVDEADLVRRQFRSVDELVEFLRQNHAGKVERSPLTRSVRPISDPGETVSTATSPEAADTWTKRAVVLVEHAIDQLVIEFAELPYLHRVEHSLHCELYALLTANRTFGRPYPLANGTAQSQLVHKEWPEPIPRPEKVGRRGNVDLAVLHPQDLAEAGIDEFREGRVRPIVAIEIGLNYDLGHLTGDVEKLTNSRVEHSYVVHLVRDAAYSLDETATYLAACPVKSAVGWVSPARTQVKLVGDSQMRRI
jgi:hypothetical protein